MIDNVEQFNGNYEIGVFDQDGVCRGAKLPVYRQQSGQYIYLLQIRGNSGYTYTFKVYDHATETELDLVDNFGEVIAYQTNYTYQWNGSNSSPTNPYHLNFSAPAQTFTKDIVGYGTSEGGYYLIASPIVEEVTPADDNGFITTAYDLYAFDQNPSDGLEWRNYEDSETGGFTIVNSKGYLYASQNDTQLTFTGTPADGDGMTVALDYTEGAQFAGWNLVGNPFTVNAYPDKAFYVMNEEGTDLTVVNRQYIEPMEGAFVCAEGEGEFVTISLTAPESKSGSLALNLSQGRGTIDRAVVKFGKGNLPKFQLNPNHTKVYIPQDGMDYAVVSADEMGEMPVNFKAEKNGTYSLSFTSQEVSFGYLHLIDNITGNDVNLLETPSYTFNATTTDYASRFRLVFATGNSNGDNFAFFNNGSFVINNEGEATLQVVDVTGRILKSESINGCANVNVNAAPGVYMLRLMNGNDVKVQKVVVK